MKRFIKKYKKPAIGLVILILNFWLKAFITPYFEQLDKFLLLNFSGPFWTIILSTIAILLFKIPIYSILLSIFLSWLIYKLIQRMLFNRRSLKIVEAKYGSGNSFADISTHLNNFVINSKLEMPLSNSVAGTDPTPGTVKVLKLKYLLNGVEKNKVVMEGSKIKLP